MMYIIMENYDSSWRHSPISSDLSAYALSLLTYQDVYYSNKPTSHRVEKNS